MFLLVTGASGVGKSTVRAAVADALNDRVEAVELWHVVPIPQQPDVEWRNRAVEAVVRRALELQEQGRHLMLSGDPVPPGELFAAPSADKLDGVAVCLLDCAPREQTARLAARGDDPAALAHHIAFAEWLREHVRDPRHRPEVITALGWDAMRWHRWTSLQAGDPRWRFTVVDTTGMAQSEAAAAVLDWARGALNSPAVPVVPAARGGGDGRP
ncbi:MAG: hypothetical protein M0026_03540 [Nocardiopsaceae bacterium]|nr:hypothetical protein [Nocardiopsaceae bacterium]